MIGLLAFSLALAGGPSTAQKGIGAPPDVPKDHWAFHAVDELFKFGLLDGYPNGTFNGSRPSSRFELAVGADNIRKALSPPVGHPSLDLTDVKAQIAALQKQLDALKSQKADIESLKTTMGVLHRHLNEVKTETGKVKTDLDKTKV